MRPAPVRARRTAAAAALIAGMLLVIGTPSALAHSEEGAMTVTAAEPAGPNQIRLEVGIVYTSDGHLAEEATVVATLTGPDGATIGPVDVPQLRSALYSTTIDVPSPGAWELTIGATEPEATATTSVTVTDEPAASTTSSTAADVIAPAPSTDAQPDGADEVGVAAMATSSTSEATSATPIIIAGVLIAAAAGAALLIVMQRRGART